MLIDSDVWIWLTRGNQRAREFLNSIDAYSISDMTYMELMQGTRSKQEMRDICKQLEKMDVERIPLDPLISEKATQLVEEFAHSHSLYAADSLIAATALVHNLPLATGNVKHFSSIPKLDLQVFSPQ